MWLQNGLLGLVLCGIFVASETVADTGALGEGNSFGTTDSVIGAVLDVESDGRARIRSNEFARLTTNPEENPKDLVGVSKTDLREMPVVEGGKHWRCLTDALYFEARGESVLGQFAVAEVILNRVDSASYPDTICGVVKQGTGRKHRCQFSFYCDGKAEVITELAAFEQVGKISKLMIDGGQRTLTDGATHYHTLNVSPKWAKVFPRTATIGFHHFYRQPVRVVRR